MAIDRNAVIREAQKFVAKGQFDKAIAEWKKIAKETPDDANVFNTIGDLCLKKNSKPEAVDAYQKAADLLAADGFTSKAIALYKKVLNIDPTKIEAHLALADLNAEKGLAGNALESYKVVVDHYTKTRETAKALGIYQKMADLNASNASFRLKLADMYAKEGMKTEAIAAYLQAADVHISKEAYKDARQIFERALALDANNRDVYHKAGLLYLKEGKFSEACRSLKPAFEADPTNTELADTYLDSLAKAGRAAEASEAYEKLLASAPDRTDLREKLYRILVEQQAFDKAFVELSTLVNAKIQGKDLAAAEEMLKQFIAAAPRNIDGKRALSALYKTVGRVDDAADALVQVAEILIEDGATDDAKDVLARAVETAPGHAASQQLLASLGPQSAAPELVSGPEPGLVPEPEPEGAPVPEFSSPPQAEPEPEPFREPESEFILEPEPEPRAIKAQPAAAPTPRAPESAPAAVSAPQAAVPAEDPAIKEALTEIDVLIKYGLSSKALEQLEALATKFPQSIQIRIKLRDLYGDLGNMGKAVTHMLILADLYTAEGKLDEASEVLQSARALEPRSSWFAAEAAPAASPGARPEEPPVPEQLTSEPLEAAVEEPAPDFLQESPAEEAVQAPEFMPEPAALSSEPEEIPFDHPFTPDFPFFEAPSEPAPGLTEKLAEQAPEPVREPHRVPEAPAPQPLQEPLPVEPFPVNGPVQEMTSHAIEQPAAEEFRSSELLAEAEFYYQQGLFDEARKQYEQILLHEPDHKKAQERITEITRDQEDAHEFSKLAEAVDGLEDLVGLAPQAGAGTQELSTSASDEEAVRSLMKEIAQIKQKPRPAPAARPAPQEPPRPPLQPAAPRAEEDFFDLSEELSQVGRAAPSGGEAGAEAESDDFFDLASELREELSTISVPPPSSESEDQSLDDIFEEFKKGVEQQAIKEDTDTHYNLGVAYKEMGLLDDAIGEFIMTPDNEPKFMQSRYMLGLCYMEKGDYENAITEIQLAVEYADRSGAALSDRIVMEYDLGLAFQGIGSREGALGQFQKVYALDRNYRDVANKLQELQDGEAISLSDLKDDIEREISSKFLEEGERIEREEKTKKNQRVRH